MTIGERIKQTRESVGMSQDELAKRMGYKDRSSISKIEKSSDDNVYINFVKNAAEILNCSTLYLMGLSNSPDDRTDKFASIYSALPEDNKELIDNMLLALSSQK